MQHIEPTWQFKWRSAPRGATWLVRVYMADGKRPDDEARSALIDTAQHAHSVEFLRGVCDGWASDRGLVLIEFDFNRREGVTVRFRGLEST
jgi:hypothetical protein